MPVGLQGVADGAPLPDDYQGQGAKDGQTGQHDYGGGKEHIELHCLSCQNAASGLRLDAGDAITLVLLAREGPCHLETLPVLVPLPFPLPGKATTVDVR